MEPIEVTGRTLEEAVQLAAAELGVVPDAVEYEVVEEGSKGFLGLGQMPTVVRAKVRDGYVAPPPGAREEPRVQEQLEPDEDVEPAAVEAPAPTAAYAGENGDFGEAVLEILNRVLKAMEMDAKPVVRDNTQEELDVELVGSDVGSLIGKQGATLDALQYLVSIAAGKASGESRRVIIDAGGHRDRHRKMLEEIARECADAVKSQGQEAELEPQSARDRRVIHLALADDPDVYTYSEGEGDNRHVVISPKK